MKNYDWLIILLLIGLAPFLLDLLTLVIICFLIYAGCHGWLWFKNSETFHRLTHTEEKMKKQHRKYGNEMRAHKKRRGR